MKRPNDRPLGTPAKYNAREWRKALRGERDIMEVLEDSFGDKHTARIVLSFLTTMAEETRLTVKVNRWGGFILGVITTLVVGGIIKIFS